MSVTMAKDGTDSSFPGDTEQQEGPSQTRPEQSLDSDLLIKNLKTSFNDQELRLAQLESFTGTLLSLMCDKGLISEKELHHVLEINVPEPIQPIAVDPRSSKPATRYKYHS